MNNEIFILQWNDERVGHVQTLHFRTIEALKKFYKINQICNHMHKISHCTFYE